MPLRSNPGRGGLFAYNELASHPLPEPAVVIDVRKTTSYDPPLAWHLTAELEDLTAQMRLYEVKRWRFLSECIEFVTLDPLPLDRTIHTATHFTITRGNGEIQSFSTKDELITHLHKEYVDLVRTNRISASRDTNQPIVSPQKPEMELERSTVRVFFLADMADPDSLTSAADYAALLRKKCEEYDNLLRSGRDERISATVICMNADRLHSRQDRRENMIEPPHVVSAEDESQSTSVYQVASQYHKLLASSIPTVFDMVMLLYAYRDDEGFVGSDAQIYELELILSTLLLAPETLATSSQEMRDEYAGYYLADLRETNPSLRRSEICMLGIASLEYSSNWARRWLDYGLVRKLLQTIRETETIEDERNLRLPDGKDWLESWWADVRSALPRTLVGVIPGAKGLSEFQRHVTSSPFHGVPLRDSLSALDNFCQNVGSCYTGNQGATLQQASQSAEQALPLLKERSRKARKDSSQLRLADEEQLRELRELQRQANLFSVSLFKGATGALPRAISQLSELESRIEEGDIGRYAHATPNFPRLHEHFEEQAQRAHHHLSAALTLWQLPLVGRMLRSTAVSLFLIILLAFGAWFLQNSLTFLPSILTHALPEPNGLSLFRLLVIMSLVLAECFYLFKRNQRLREQRNRILQTLCQTAIAHLTEVQLSIAGKIALRLVQEAGLYHPKGKAGHYKQKLRALDKVLKEAQEQASLHHRGAYERLKLGLSPIQTGTLSTRTWLNLNTRKDLLQWEQTIETFQQLGDELLRHNQYLDMLAKSLLRQLATEQQSSSAISLVPQDRHALTAQEQLQAICSELVATLLVAEIIGASLVTLDPLLERYVSLKQRGQYAPSPLGESVAELYDVIRAMKLEQTMNSDRGVASQQEAFESFITKVKKPVEQMLVAWVGNLHDTDDRARDLLKSDSILARLQAFQIKVADALEDLRRRCKMLGYHDELINGDDAYMLLVPQTDNHELQAALADLQFNQIRLLPFPDKEKLIYLHTYRVDIRS